MKACGIIAEYNPFHNGHLYQLEEAKKRTKADVVIVVMSGNFLQRGEPALVDKWARAKMALAAGADIVVELPVEFSVQAADFFAKGSLEILHQLQADYLCFGAESGTNKEFMSAGRTYVEKEKAIDQAFHSLKMDGKTYASKMEEAIKTILPDFPLNLSEPNNQLGFAYAKENEKYEKALDLEVIRRKGAGYLDEELHEGKNIASATAIRKHIFTSGELNQIESFVPDKTFQILKNTPYINWEDFWPLLQYKLTLSSVEDLNSIYQMEEGIEYRFKEAIIESNSFEELLSRVKSKRITWTRLQRVCIYILLDITKEQMRKECNEIKAVRLLAFSDDGQRYLNENKHKMTVPLLTNINYKTENLWETTIIAGEIYRLIDKQRIKKQDFTRNPLKSVDISLSH